MIHDKNLVNVTFFFVRNGLKKGGLNSHGKRIPVRNPDVAVLE